jgi:hypothetical protein
MSIILTNTSSYVYLAADGAPTLQVPVATADHGSAVFARYRDQYALGASDLHQRCGNIYAEDGTLVARISYNGHLCTPDDRLLQKPAPPT